MNSIARNVSYELQIYRNGRWQIQSLYGSEGRAAAVAAAKLMSRDPTVDGVRVVKEAYDAYDARDQSEFVVYSSRKVRLGHVRPLAEREIDLDYRPGEDWMGLGRRRKLARIEARRAFRRRRGGIGAAWDELPLASKTIFGLTAAFVVATFLTVLAALFLPTDALGRSGRGMAFVVMFVLIFLACGGPVVVWSIVSGISAQGGSPNRRKTKAPAPPAGEPPPRIKSRTEYVPEPPPEPEPEPPSVPPEIEKAREFLSSFAKQCRRRANAAFDLKDDYLGFGVDLFVAGAAEPVCDHHAVQAADRAKVIGAVLTNLGVAPQRAESFAARAGEYLIADVRYMEMFTAGRDAMAGYLNGDSNSFDSLSLALADWSGTPGAKADDSVVTLMFTAIDDLDGLTASRGDEIAAQVARVHHRIASRLIDDHGGKRVKQTSDGVMIAFASAVQAVRAAVAMQRAAARHRAEAPAYAFDLKIGMNAGTPVVEDDDYFGNAVQCAARLCHGAGKNTIVVSGLVRNLCAGYDALPEFVAGGELALKGFEAPVAVFTVHWPDTPIAEPAADPPADPAANPAENAAPAATPPPGGDPTKLDDPTP